MQSRNQASWPCVWVWLACALLGFACEGPGARILLGPLPPRRDAAVPDADAAPALPAGAVPCVRDADCNDGIDCTVDACLPERYCSITLDHIRCSNHLTCDGIESCDATLGCVAGPAPSCDDRDACTIDRCDEAAKDCVHDPRDFDHDGDADYHCAGGTDCDDFNPARSSSVAEVCDDGIDNDCDERIDEADCGKTAHDSCDDALDISAGGSFEVSLIGAVDDYVTSCGEMSPSRDVVFAFTLDAPRDVKLVARGLLAGGMDEESSLSIERSCGDWQTELQCTHNFPGDLRVRALPAGRYFVIASSIVAARSLLLDASFTAATAAPSNMTCATATDIGQGGHFEGSFVDVGDETMSPCGVAGQPDVFYSFTLEAEHDVEISALSDEQGALTVSVRKACGANAEVLSCESVSRVLTRVHQLPKGSYVLVLEGPSTHEIGFTLDVAIVEPTPAPEGDGCVTPLKIAIGDTRRVTLSNLQDDVSSSCESAGPDAVLALNVPTTQDLQIKLVSEDNNALATFALQTICGEPRSEQTCRPGMPPVTTRLHDVIAGSYFLVLDSPTAAGITIKIEGLPLTTVTPTMNNDNCNSATLIPPEGGLFSGDTRPLMPDYGGACGSSVASKDAAFKLVLTERRHVVATVDARFDSVLLRFNSPTAGGLLCSDPKPAACVDDMGAGNSAGLDEMLEAGTYYYVIEGFKDFNAGLYVLDVSVTEP